MNIYTGATQHHHRTQAVFNQSEDYGKYIIDNKISFIANKVCKKQLQDNLALGNEIVAIVNVKLLVDLKQVLSEYETFMIH